MLFFDCKSLSTYHQRKVKKWIAEGYNVVFPNLFLLAHHELVRYIFHNAKGQPYTQKLSQLFCQLESH